MKIGIKIAFFCFVFNVLALTSCKDLDMQPLDQITTDNYWEGADELEAFVNGFYRIFPRYVGDNVPHDGGADGSNNGNLDYPSDILVNTSPASLLMQKGNSGEAPISDNNWDNLYNWIRQINFFIENSKKVRSRDERSDQYIGEGYFFRAFEYFELLKRYGGVPIIKLPLNADDKEQLYSPRGSRYEVAKFIIQDLDSAIANMNWKGVGSAAEKGRVNKEAAIVMKSRVALYEGTWELYHQNDAFKSEGHDGKEFLRMVIEVIDPLIARQGDDIFKAGGEINEPYNQLFAQADGSTVPGVFLYRVYDASLIGGNSFYEKMYRAPSFTDHMVNAYLDQNGIPRELSNLPINKDNLYSLGKYLDPRFNETIWVPNKGPMAKVSPSLGENPIYLPNSRYPYISSTQGDYYTASGYRGWKGAVLDPSEYRNGSTDDILIRYGEGLLNYAEAKAVLGEITQSDIDKTVNLLRSRVGMSPMELADVASWPKAIYSETLGFDQSETNIVNEIRRERLVELAWEGFRMDDIKRWGVFEEVINGYKPKGPKIDQFLNYYNNVDSLVTDGYTASQAQSLKLTVGNGFGVDDNGYINPFYKSPDFQSGGSGYFINPNRDYLDAIPKGQIALYKKNGVDLTQNPGWF